MSASYIYIYVCCCLFCLCLLLSQNQAKLFIEQKKIPFPVDNHNTNEELGKFARQSKCKTLIYAEQINMILPFFFIIICSVVAAIGYVLIGNGLYDEAIKHFSLLLQVCLRLQKQIFSLSTFYLDLIGQRRIKTSFLCVLVKNMLLTCCVFDTGWPGAGQRHLWARDSLWEKKSTGEW